MIDYVKIGKRIHEERKYIHHISQERMAEELGMYQADISNMERAQKSSGINDLYKLEDIADYFGLPIENLLFGSSMEAHMVKYFGRDMELRQIQKKKLYKTDKQKTILGKLMGKEYIDNQTPTVFECGPYYIYIFFEQQTNVESFDEEGKPKGSSLVKEHFFVFFNDTVISTMTAAAVPVNDILDNVKFETVQTLVQPDVIDVADIQVMLNPFISIKNLMIKAEETKELEDVIQKEIDRTTNLKPFWKHGVYLVESVYVMEDCRRKGMLKMMIDILKLTGPAIIWLNLEPVSELGLEDEFDSLPSVKSSEVGQLNINAAIAEKLGMTVCQNYVTRNCEVVNEDGSKEYEDVEVRKAAYFMSKKLRTFLEEDEDSRVLSMGVLSLKPEEPVPLDIFHGSWKEHGQIISIKAKGPDGTVYVFARGKDRDHVWFGVSKENPSRTGKLVDTIERYDSLKEALESSYIEMYKKAYAWIMAVNKGVDFF